MSYILDSYNKLISLGIKQQDVANILPLGHHTTIVCKINIRALSHMFEVRECTRAYEEFRKLMKELRGVLKELDEDWAYLCDNYFKVKCVKKGYCEERNCCGLRPKKEEIDLLINNYIEEKKKLKL